jgi:hypothetical protein
MNRIRRTFPKLSSRIALALTLAMFSTAAALAAQCTVQETRECSSVTYYILGFWPVDGGVTCTITRTTICN